MIDFSGNEDFQSSLQRHSERLDSLQKIAVEWGLTEHDEIASGFALEFVGGQESKNLAISFAAMTWNILNPDRPVEERSAYLDALGRDYFLGAVQSITWHHDKGASEFNRRFLLVLRGDHKPLMETSSRYCKDCEKEGDSIVADDVFDLAFLGLYEFDDELPHRVRLQTKCDVNRPLLFVSFPTWDAENPVLQGR